MEGLEQVEAERVSAVERLERRDRELTALLNSARALAQIDDVDTLLQELVDRADELMGSDLTYLSAYDEATGDLWVRASRGATSETLRTLRVPAGSGLASRVVQTQSAQWTMDYQNANLKPDDQVTAAVDDEGLKSLLGVPMSTKGQLLGVLFTAYRYPHQFTAEEIALLSAFADHAAVVLHRARLFARIETSAQEAEAAQLRAERHATAMEHAAQVHERLTSLVLGGEEPASVCRALASALKVEVAAVRPDATLLAGDPATLWDSSGQLRSGLADALEESARTGRAVLVPVDEGRTVITTAVAAGTPIVSLVVTGVGSLTGLELRTVERTSQLLALLLMQRESQALAEDVVRGELTADLVAGRVSPAVARHRAEARGLHLADRYIPLAAPMEGARRRTVRRHLATVAPQVLTTDHDSGLTILHPADEPVDLPALRRHLGIHTPWAGLLLVGEKTETTGMPRAVERTWQLLTVLPGLGVHAGDAHLTAYTPYLAVFGGQADRAKDFVHSIIGDLLERDEKADSELVLTLATYLDTNANLRRTAEQLFVHVNTVKQRLSRVTDILGEGWREPEPTFRLRVALRLHQARAAASAVPRS